MVLKREFVLFWNHRFSEWEFIIPLIIRASSNVAITAESKEPLYICWCWILVTDQPWFVGFSLYCNLFSRSCIWQSLSQLKLGTGLNTPFGTWVNATVHLGRPRKLNFLNLKLCSKITENMPHRQTQISIGPLTQPNPPWKKSGSAHVECYVGMLCLTAHCVRLLSEALTHSCVASSQVRDSCSTPLPTDSSVAKRVGNVDLGRRDVFVCSRLHKSSVN